MPRSTCVAAVRGFAAVLTVAVLAAIAPAAEEAEGRASAECRLTPLGEIAGFEPLDSQPADALADHPELQREYEQARAMVEDERFAPALELLDTLIERPAGRGYETYHLRAVTLARLGRVAEAVESGRTAVAYRPDGVDAHFLLGGLLHREGRLDDATVHFRAATLAADRELNNTKVTLSWLLLGQVLSERGCLLAALESYERFDEALWGTHPEQRNADEVRQFLAARPRGALELRLKLAYELDRKDEAARITEWAVETWPDDPQVARLHASALLDAGRAAQAFEFCGRRSDRREFAALLLPTMVDAARSAGRLEAWIQELLERLTEGAPADEALALVRILNSQEEFSAAAALATALSKRRPESFDAAWESAIARWSTGDAAGALDTLIGYVRANPDRPVDVLEGVTSWMRDETARGALLSLVNSLRKREDRDFATDFVAGVVAASAGEAALAEELLESCTRAREDYAPAYVVRVQILLHERKWEAAIEAARVVLERKPELPAAHFALAQAFDGLDRHADAEKAYKAAIRYAPQEAAYRLGLAEFSRRNGDLLGAQRYSQEALLRDPGSGPAAEALIEAYLVDGKLDLAREQFMRMDTQALPPDSVRRITTMMRHLGNAFSEEHLADLQREFEQDPGDIATGRLLAAGLFVWDRVEEARSIVTRVLEAAPDDYNSRMLMANVQLRSGNAAEAIPLLEALAREYPNRREVLTLLADALRWEFRTEQARTVYQRLIERDPDRRDAHRAALLDTFHDFGDAKGALPLLDEWSAEARREEEAERLAHQRLTLLLGARQYAEALELARRRLDERPTDPYRRDVFVRVCLQARAFDDAVDRLREWTAAEGDDADLMDLYIETLLQAGRADDALEAAQKFEGNWTGEKRRRIWMAECHAKAGRLDTAVKEFDALLAERMLHESEIVEVRRRLMIALVDAGRFDEALRRCEDWLGRLGDQSAAARYAMLALKRGILMEANRTADYIRVMEEMLELAPDDAGLNNDLGYTWVDHNANVQRATEMIRLAVRAEPLNAAYLDSLGWAYYKNGDFESALMWLKRSASLREGRDAVVFDHVGDAAYRLDDLETARRYWELAQKTLEERAEGRQRPDDVALAGELRRKLEALDAGRPPPVALTAEESAASQADAP